MEKNQESLDSILKQILNELKSINEKLSVLKGYIIPNIPDMDYHRLIEKRLVE